MKHSILGYTLIELLIVMSIISILAGVGYVNYRDFSINQDTVKTIGQIQSFLRLAQSNATSNTKCNGLEASAWYFKFLNATTLELRCDPNDYLHRSYTLENAKIDSISGSSCDPSSSIVPLTLKYLPGFGALTFSSSVFAATPACLASNTWSVKIISLRDGSKFKKFTLSKGGAIDVAQ